MTKDILKLTATFLGLEDVLSVLKSNTLPEEIPASEGEKISQLITFLNYVLYEVTKEYYPLSKEECLSTDENKKIYYNKFSNIPISIKDIKNSIGLSVKAQIFPEYVLLEKANSTYKVTYNYVISPINNLNDKLVLPLGLDYHILAYGVASEYALSNLLYDEAQMWENKFHSALQRIKNNVGERRFYARKLK